MDDLNEHVECSLTTKNIFTATMHMATKLGKVVTHNGRFPTVKSYDALISWSCEIAWQRKTIISPLRQCL